MQHPLAPLIDALIRLQGEMARALREGDADALPPLAERFRQGLAVLSRYAGQPLPMPLRDEVAQLKVRAQAMNDVLARRQRGVDNALAGLVGGSAGLQEMHATRVYGAGGKLAATGWRSRGLERA